MGFDLIARLGMNSSGFDQGLARAELSFEKFSAHFGARFAALFSVGAVEEGIRRTVEFGKHIADVAQQFGISAEQVQEFNFAAKLSGTELETFTAALRKLAQARTEALKHPEGAQARAFSEFGMDREFLRNTSDARELMFRLSDAVKGTAIDLNSIPQILELIGQRNTELIPALTAGLRDAAEEAHQLGLVMKNETAEALAEMDDQFDRLILKGKVLFAQPVADLLKYVNEGLKGLDMFAAGFARARSGKGTFYEGAMDRLIELEKLEAQTSATREAARRRIDVPERDPEKLLREAESRLKVMDRIQEKIRKLALNEQTPAERLATLKSQREKVLAELNQNPESLELQEQVADLDLEVQAARKAIKPEKGLKRENFDALAAIGGFTGGVGAEERSIQMEIRDAVRESTQLLRRIEAEGF